MAPYDETDPNIKYYYTTDLHDEDSSRMKLEEELYCALPEV